MVFEFPAVSQTRKQFWNHPQYTRNGMWWFTLILGFFGLHHLLLRSPQTAIIAFVINIFTLGYWWSYDLVQLAARTTNDLNEYGMDHPWGFLGIAQGMWLPDDGSVESEGPNPVWFFLYCLLLPIAPLAQAIAGDTQNALTRFFNLTIIPLGFILFGCAILNDYWLALAKPATLCIAGSSRFFPYTMLGWDVDGYSPTITGNETPPSCPRPSLIASMTTAFLPFLDIVHPPSAALIRKGMEGVQHVKTVATTVATTGVKAVTTAATLPGKIVGAATGPLQKASEIIANPAAASAAKPAASSAASAGKAVKSSIATEVGTLQSGGARNEKTPLDYVAAGSIGALIIGGLVVALTRSSNGKQTDSPPKPAAV